MPISKKLASITGPHYGAGTGTGGGSQVVNDWGMVISNNQTTITFNIDTNLGANSELTYQFVGAQNETFLSGGVSGTVTLDESGNCVITRTIDIDYQATVEIDFIINLKLYAASGGLLATSPALVDTFGAPISFANATITTQFTSNQYRAVVFYAEPERVGTGFPIIFRSTVSPQISSFGDNPLAGNIVVGAVGIGGDGQGGTSAKDLIFGATTNYFFYAGGAGGGGNVQYAEFTTAQLDLNTDFTTTIEYINTTANGNVQVAYTGTSTTLDYFAKHGSDAPSSDDGGESGSGLPGGSKLLLNLSGDPVVYSRFTQGGGGGGGAQGAGINASVSGGTRVTGGLGGNGTDISIENEIFSFGGGGGGGSTSPVLRSGQDGGGTGGNQYIEFTATPGIPGSGGGGGGGGAGPAHATTYVSTGPYGDRYQGTSTGGTGGHGGIIFIYKHLYRALSLQA